MARHRRYSVEFKRRVAQEHLADGVTLGALPAPHRPGPGFEPRRTSVVCLRSSR